MAFTFTDENVNEIIATGQPVMIDFWATWCGPCMGMSPVIDALAAEYEGRVLIGKYNTEDESDFAVDCRVMALPTLMFFKGGEMVGRLAGSQSRETLVAKLDELLAK